MLVSEIPLEASAIIVYNTFHCYHPGIFLSTMVMDVVKLIPHSICAGKSVHCAMFSPIPCLAAGTILLQLLVAATMSVVQYSQHDSSLAKIMSIVSKCYCSLQAQKSYSSLEEPLLAL